MDILYMVKQTGTAIDVGSRGCFLMRISMTHTGCLTDLNNYPISHLNSHPTALTVHSWASLCDLQIHSWLWCVTEMGWNELSPATATHLPGWHLTDMLLSVTLFNCCYNRLSHLPDGCKVWEIQTQAGPSIWSLLWTSECNRCGVMETRVAIFGLKIPGGNILCWHLIFEIYGFHLCLLHSVLVF